MTADEDKVSILLYACVIVALIYLLILMTIKAQLFFIPDIEWEYVLLLLAIIATFSAPFVYNSIIYHFTKPRFKIHFKPTRRKSFEEIKLQRLELQPNRQQLVWVMIHNDGRVITEGWYCLFGYPRNFKPIQIKDTRFRDVDFIKEYTIQKKYSSFHFKSTDFSPLFPHNETFVFPMVIKTPNAKGDYVVEVSVFTGNHKIKFYKELSINIV